MRFIPAVFLISVCLQAQTGSAPARPPVPLPQIRQNGGVKQMFVDGKPFIMLAGELHNSSASGLESMTIPSGAYRLPTTREQLLGSALPDCCSPPWFLPQFRRSFAPNLSARR